VTLKADLRNHSFTVCQGDVTGETPLMTIGSLGGEAELTFDNTPCGASA
jgi:hypothetical protein